MKIINERFEVGQRYIGMVDGTPFTVVKIQPPGIYESQYGYTYTVPQTQIFFRDENTGKTHATDLETAKRLLLRPVEKQGQPRKEEV